MNAQTVIDRLRLHPHPEGGYFRETYRSTESISIDGFDGDRNYSTAIYFMLTSENFSAFHRIKQDEVWHFYTGSSLYVHVIDKSGKYVPHVVGVDLANGAVPQLVVKAGDWFGSSVIEKNSFSLVGCTVAPGFDFRDFEMAKREDLLTLFPDHEEIIHRLTRI
jgi:predicted cupin superfamily sugar epimerase